MTQSDTPGVVTGKPLIESDQVEGSAVYDASGKFIGSVTRLMIDKMGGRIAYAVVSFDGFVGLGEAQHTVPWSKLSYDNGLGGYRTDITQEQLTRAPMVPEDEKAWWDRRREEDIHDHWKVPPYWGWWP